MQSEKWKKRVGFRIPVEYDHFPDQILIDVNVDIREHLRVTGQWPDRFTKIQMVTWTLWESEYLYIPPYEDIDKLEFVRVVFDPISDVNTYIYDHPSFPLCAPGAQPMCYNVGEDWAKGKTFDMELNRRRTFGSRTK